MRRQALPLMLVVTIAGCVSAENGSPTVTACQGRFGRVSAPPTVPGLEGPLGQAVPLQGTWAFNPPGSASQAREMMKNSVDLKYAQVYDENGMQDINVMLAQKAMSGSDRANFPMPFPKGGLIAPRGMPLTPGMPNSGVLQAGYSSGQTTQQPGYNWGYNGYSYYNYPGYGYYNSYPAYPNPNDKSQYRANNGEIIYAELRSDGPSSGSVQQAQYVPPTGYPTGGFGAGGMGPGYPPVYCPPGGVSSPGYGMRTQIKFTKPVGMKVYWITGMGSDGRPVYSPYMEAPGRYNFVQGAVYRLKINNIEDRPAVELYPTLEVMTANAMTQEFLSHSAVPLGFSDDDFKQVAEGNYLVKVIYLPLPQFQDPAGPGGIEELLSTRLDPGTDPVKEARRRGNVLLVIRMGNVDQGLTHTPPLTARSGPAVPGPVGPGGPPPIGPGYPPVGPGYPPVGMGYGPMGPGYPPGGPGCPPGMMPPTYSLGGSDQQPFYICPRPLVQVPYMYWPFGPYANAPQNFCYPPIGPGGPPAGYQPAVPQYPPGYPRTMSGPPALSNPPGNLTPPPPAGDAPKKMQLDGAVKDPFDKERARDLPPPFQSDDKVPASSSSGTAGNPTSLSLPSPPADLGGSPTAPLPEPPPMVDPAKVGSAGTQAPAPPAAPEVVPVPSTPGALELPGSLPPAPPAPQSSAVPPPAAPGSPAIGAATLPTPPRPAAPPAPQISPAPTTPAGQPPNWESSKPATRPDTATTGASERIAPQPDLANVPMPPVLPPAQRSAPAFPQQASTPLNVPMASPPNAGAAPLPSPPLPSVPPRRYATGEMMRVT